jgi:hypothetical protein
LCLEGAELGDFGIQVPSLGEPWGLVVFHHILGKPMGKTHGKKLRKKGGPYRVKTKPWTLRVEIRFFFWVD